MIVILRSAALFVFCLSVAFQALGHGSLAPEDDICLLQIGFLKAHFKIYLPRTHGHEQFCEDLPRAAEALFVMEYGHDSLADMWIDFRIIRDLTGKNEFIRERDISGIEDLEAVTVAYHPPRRELDVYSIVHQFDEPGWYVGIIRAKTLNLDKTYTAVFPFEVGFTGYDYWPLVALALSIFGFLLYYDSRTRKSKRKSSNV